MARADYAKIREQLAIFIGETIPNPVLTTHGMWAITAYPSTGQTKQRHRIMTISCGPVETLVIGEEIAACVTFQRNLGQPRTIPVLLDFTCCRQP